MKLMSSSIGRKILMALSGIFLVVFLTQHFLINITSVFSESLFNTLSHFMGKQSYGSISTPASFNTWCCLSFCNGILFRNIEF